MKVGILFLMSMAVLAFALLVRRDSATENRALAVSSSIAEGLSRESSMSEERRSSLERQIQDLGNCKSTDDALRLKVSLESNAEHWQTLGPSFYHAWGLASGRLAVEDALLDSAAEGVTLAVKALTGWAQVDRQAAREWVSEFEGDDQRLFVEAVHGASSGSVEGLASPADWIEAHSADVFADTLVADILKQEEQSLSGVADWVGTLPEGGSRQSAYESTLSEWGHLDPTQASRFLAEMENSPDRDHAVGAFVRSIAVENSEAAKAWAETIEDSELRHAHEKLVADTITEYE